MANRLILTLLALLTGLAAPASAQQARAAQLPSAQQVRMIAEAAATKAPRAPVALARLPEPGWRNTRIHAPSREIAPAVRSVPAVLTRIDRARE
ncbi:hypothetical protein I5E68_12325 [Novosphingobium sp. YJ-S2-02]|uniref:Uncharacterized protein n=2 Tax=Novosphingobium aureum TaxID=2792964 RepID=A0A931HE21_9SPHN|nr:hypothetical protein [Novosphingobium aureum]